MKITNLIIPLLGLTTINNANNQANAIQIEKEINMPYEILARDNWGNYLVNENATENLIQKNGINYLDSQNEFRGIISHSSCRDACYRAYEASHALCCAALWNPAAFAVCAAAAGTALGLCYVACRS